MDRPAKPNYVVHGNSGHWEYDDQTRKRAGSAFYAYANDLDEYIDYLEKECDTCSGKGPDHDNLCVDCKTCSSKYLDFKHICVDCDYGYSEWSNMHESDEE